MWGIGGLPVPREAEDGSDELDSDGLDAECSEHEEEAGKEGRGSAQLQSPVGVPWGSQSRCERQRTPKQRLRERMERWLRLAQIVERNVAHRCRPQCMPSPPAHGLPLQFLEKFLQIFSCDEQMSSCLTKPPCHT